MKDLRINGLQITASGFGFDGCHKFYLIESPDDAQMLSDYDYQLYLIDSLPQMWAGSCPLRFINSADLTTCYVPQFEPAYFEGDWLIDEQLRKELDELAAEQIAANNDM